MFDDLFTDFVLHGALPLGADAAEAIQSLPRQQLLLIAYAAVDLLGDGFGVALVEQGIARDQIPAPLTAAALEADAGFAQILAGGRVVARGDADAALVRLIQRGMQAVSARVLGAPRELALPAWGADGDFGAQTARALAALRLWRGLGGQGAFAASDARALLALLAGAPSPDLWATASAAAVTVTDAASAQISAGAARAADIARAICDATAAAPFSLRVDGRLYRYHAETFGTQALSVGTLRGPGGVGYSLNPAREYWKCNIFGGLVIALAGLPVPTFQVGPHRHYPRAERFGLALARKAGWELVTALDHRDPADPTIALTGPTQEAQIEALLRAARPGDLLFVDHPGEPGENGGHTRVCVEAARASDPDAAPLFAQARQDAARMERDGLKELGGGHEIQLWLLRYTG